MRGMVLHATTSHFSMARYGRMFRDGQLSNDILEVNPFGDVEHAMALQEMYQSLSVRIHAMEKPDMSDADKSTIVNARLSALDSAIGRVPRRIKEAADLSAKIDPTVSWSTFLHEIIGICGVEYCKRFRDVCESFETGKPRQRSAASRSVRMSPQLREQFLRVARGGVFADSDLIDRLLTIGASTVDGKPTSAAVVEGCRQLVYQYLDSVCADLLDRQSELARDLLAVYAFYGKRGTTVTLKKYSTAGQYRGDLKHPGKENMEIKEIELLQTQSPVALKEGVLYRLAERHPEIDLLFVEKLASPTDYKLKVFQVSLSMYENVTDAQLKERAPALFEALQENRVLYAGAREASESASTSAVLIPAVSCSVHTADYKTLTMKTGPSFRFIRDCLQLTFSRPEKPRAFDQCLKHVEYYYVTPHALPYYKDALNPNVFLVAGGDLASILDRKVFEIFKSHGEERGLWPMDKDWHWSSAVDADVVATELETAAAVCKSRRASSAHTKKQSAMSLHTPS
eukprot:TRINITY_DN10696_c0_g1_i1.p1 TRINITY_DN10696_c0_g1~~TRINITY_DN10696_c0_g1_i1.p1  ORF type:complete len:513 (-),score=96.11 TRINITY_DN10696_c0_g1_i1:293-1831(-)